MRRVYERFCSRHNEAVNFYKDLMTKDKRFKAFIKVRQQRRPCFRDLRVSHSVGRSAASDSQSHHEPTEIVCGG